MPSGERLVAATPKTVGQLCKLGYEVVVESGAGVGASFADDNYAEAEATIGNRSQAWSADIVVTVNAPVPDDIARLKPDAMLISRLAPHSNKDLLTELADHGVTALALDAVPRISRAQSLDVLSTMSNVSGYRAVIEAAEEFGGMFAGQVTAAGKTPPAKVFVIGGGVAGLAAIGAAVSMGAEVRAFDVRPEAGEQIESLGATFVRAPEAQQEKSSTGYAKALSDTQQQAALELYAKESAQADIVITTALVRGAAVRTITKEAVSDMKPGSVIVDVAATGCGNCELTEPGRKIRSDNGVTIIGYTDLASRMPQHTSQLYGTNVVNLMKLLTPNKDGHAVLNLDDAVQRGMTVTKEHELLWPPPEVSVSVVAKAGPRAGSREMSSSGAQVAAESDAVSGTGQAVGSAERQGSSAGQSQQSGLATLVANTTGAETSHSDNKHTHTNNDKQSKSTRNTALVAIAGIILAVALAFADTSFLTTFSIFVLAIFVGYYVVSNVSHSLHTPLMSQTNAISGIILIGSLSQIGSDNLLVTILAVISAAIASINVFGGFLVTYRMLSMFRKEA
jgi:NAD(P) transhydrogenase subunit alpha